MPTEYASSVLQLPTSITGAAAPTTAANDKHKVERRLTPKLATAWAAVPSILIQGAQRLRPHEGARGLNPTEVLTLIHLLDRKWGEKMPFPAITTIAEQMGLKPRSVRGAIKRLEDLGFIKRHPMTNGGPNRYDLKGLFAALEKLVDEDLAAADAASEAAKAE